MVVPPSVPPPVAMATETGTPAWATAFPAESRSWITGCWANATPLCAVAEGWVVMPSSAAGPAESSTAAEVSGVRPAPANTRV